MNLNNFKGRNISSFIKLQCLKYYRLDKRCTLACTEAINKSDVNVLYNNHLIEIEIKTSISDLKAEFSGKSKIKKTKHQRYNSKYTQNNKKYKNYIVPNYYFFCVPKELALQTKQYLEKLDYTNYGILICNEYKNKNKQSHIEVYKNAIKLHNNKIDNKIKDKLEKRLTNENINYLNDKLEKLT